MTLTRGRHVPANKRALVLRTSVTLVTLFVDIRPGHCYRELDDSRPERCDHSLASNLTRRQCCCSIGEGWNAVEDEHPGTTSCHPCPATGTGTFSTLQHSSHFLTLSPSITLRLYTLPHWSNPPFLIFDIRALWRSGAPVHLNVKN